MSPRPDLQAMSLGAALGYGRRYLNGAAYDSLFNRLIHTPDGQPPDVQAACDELIAWCARVQEFAVIVRQKV